MSPTSDPFVHHPELRERIIPHHESVFRDFTIDGMIERFPQMAVHRSWAYSDGVREAMRAKTLAQRAGDIWIFAYGSLMWDPALRFAEVRRARLPGFSRRFILLDEKGGRGTAEAPGLMAALDRGDACEGLVFRIAADEVDCETEILWRREIVGPAYSADFVRAEIGAGSVEVLAFVADHSVPEMRPDLSRDQQVHYIATGEGFFGSSHAYLASIVGQFDALGIHDEDCVSLLKEVEAYRAAHGLG